MATEQLVGALPAGWEYTTLSEACSRGGGGIQTGPFGNQLHSADYVSHGIPSIMPQNLGDNRVVHEGIAQISQADAERLDHYRVRAGDIVYSRRGDVEKRALIRKQEDGWLCGTGCLRVRFGEGGIDSTYASYYLGDPRVREWIVRHAHGATMPNLNTGILSALPFVVPRISDQRVIARVLSTLDDKIDLNCRVIRTLEAIAQALFKAWFVDFDPVLAKEEKPHLKLSREVADFFPRSLEKSGPGERPSGWRLVALDELIDLNPSRRLLPGTSAPYLDMANMPTRGHSISEVSERRYSSGARFVNGDTLVARITPCLENGKTAYVDFLQEGQVGWGSTEYIVLRPKPPLPTEYAYCLARSDRFREFAIQSMTGSSGRQRVPTDSLAGFMLASPPQEIAEAFGKIAQPLFARARLATIEGRTLASIRDTLLPKLISGELRIKDAEHIVGAHT